MHYRIIIKHLTFWSYWDGEYSFAGDYICMCLKDLFHKYSLNRLRNMLEQVHINNYIHTDKSDFDISDFETILLNGNTDCDLYEDYQYTYIIDFDQCKCFAQGGEFDLEISFSDIYNGIIFTDNFMYKMNNLTV